MGRRPLGLVCKGEFITYYTDEEYCAHGVRLLTRRPYLPFSESFFLGRSWLLWPQAFLRQLVARGGSVA